MQFSILATLTFAATGALSAAVAPRTAAVGKYAAAIPHDMTIEQAGDTCGKDMELNCCNEIDQSGDSVNEAEGILAGVLQGGLLQNGDVGLFKGCSKLDIPSKLIFSLSLSLSPRLVSICIAFFSFQTTNHCLLLPSVIGITDLLNSKCKQNVACCQHSGTAQVSNKNH